jgi:hypothetical protein
MRPSGAPFSIAYVTPVRDVYKKTRQCVTF